MPGSSKSSNGTPAAPPSLQKSTSSSKNQTSIAGFFKRKDLEAPQIGTPMSNGVALRTSKHAKGNGPGSSAGPSIQSLTPVASSDGAEEADEVNDVKPVERNGKQPSNGLPSPVTPAITVMLTDGAADHVAPKGFYSPSRKVWLSFGCTAILY